MSFLNSQDVSVLTPREISKPDADAHGRPEGMTALIPVRVQRNLGSDDTTLIPKTENNFGPIPTGAAHFRPKVYRAPTHALGAEPITLEDWAAQFEPTVYGGGPIGVAPLITDARAGELKTADYTNLATVTGDPGVIKRGEVVKDLNPFVGNPTYSDIKALDVAVSRTGRFTYTLWFVNDSVGPSYHVIFIAFDNTTGLEVDRHDVQSNPGNAFTARGNICVIDDSTGESAPDLTFADCLVAVQTFDGVGAAYTDVAFLDYTGPTSWTLSPFTPSLAFGAAPGFDPWSAVQINNRGVGVYYVHWSFREDPGGATARLQENVYTPAGGFLATQYPFGPATDLDWAITPVMVQRKRDPGTADNLVFYAAIPFGFPATIALTNSVFGAPFGVACGPGVIVVPETVTALEADAIDPTAPIAGYTWPVFLTYAGQGAGTNNIIAYLIDTIPAGGISAAINIALGDDVVSIVHLGCRQLRKLNRDPSIVLPPPQPVARVAIVSSEPDTTGGLNGKKFYTETEIFDDGLNFTVDPRTTTPTVTNTNLNTLFSGDRSFHFDVPRWIYASPDPADLQALVYGIAGASAGYARTVAPFSGFMIEWNAREYERCLLPIRRENHLNVEIWGKGQGQDKLGFQPGIIVRTLRHPAGPDPTDYGSSLQLDGFTLFDTAGFTPDSNTAALAPTLQETEPAILWPLNGLGNDTFQADVDEVGSAGPGPRHLKNISWGIEKVVGATGLATSDYGSVLVGHTIRITEPATLIGRYNIVAFDVDANGIITDIELSPPPPAGTAGTATTIRALITAAPSDSLRMIVTPRTDPDGIAHSNAIHPAVIDIDYIRIKSDETTGTPTGIPNGLILVPLQNGQLPSIVSVSLKAWLPSPAAFPPPLPGVEIELISNTGPLLVRKSITDTVVTSQKQPGGTATVFGTQSFNDDTFYGAVPGPYPLAPDGPQRGDFLNIFSGPNKGIYIIQELYTDPSSNHRIIVDRPFPSSGAGGNPAWAITSTRKTDMGGGLFLFSMSFDVTGLAPAAMAALDIRTSFRDQGLPPVTYEIDSIAVQWS